MFPSFLVFATYSFPIWSYFEIYLMKVRSLLFFNKFLYLIIAPHFELFPRFSNHLWSQFVIATVFFIGYTARLLFLVLALWRILFIYRRSWIHNFTFRNYLFGCCLFDANIKQTSISVIFLCMHLGSFWTYFLQKNPNLSFSVGVFYEL